MKLFGGSGHNKNDHQSGHQNKQQKPEARRRETPENGKPQRKGAKGFVIALIIIAVVVGGGFAYWKISTRPPDVTPEQNDGEQDGEQSGEVQIVDTADREIGHYYTVLVVGKDQEGLNTDTIMLARFDAVGKSVNIVSIPRDTVVNTDSDISKKINSVYQFGGNGIDSLMDRVADITGFRPDNYVVVDINVFVEVVDAMGGVEFDVPIDMNYDDYATYPNGEPYEFTIHVNKGLQELNGYDALGVFRFRQNNNGTGYPMGDIQRLDCQHQLMMAIAQKAMSTRSVTKLMNIVNAVIGNCVTNLSVGNIQWYVEQFLTMSLENIQFFTAPTTGCWIGGTTYVTLSVDDWMTMVNEKINPMKSQIKKEECEIIYPAVTKALVNGQFYYKPSDLAVTNGKDVYTNFPN